MNRNPYFQILPQSNLAMLAIFGDLAARLSKESSDLIGDLHPSQIPTIYRTTISNSLHDNISRCHKNNLFLTSPMSAEQSHPSLQHENHYRQTYMDQTVVYPDYGPTRCLNINSKDQRSTNEIPTDQIWSTPDSNGPNISSIGNPFAFKSSAIISRQGIHNQQEIREISPKKLGRDTIECIKPCEESTICLVNRKRKSSGSGLGNDESMDQTKRHRTSYTQQQVQLLEQAYQDDRYISRPQRTKLASELNLPESTIKVWFQNRRMKEKRQALMLPTLAGKDPYLRETLLRVTQLYYASRYGIENHLTSTTSSSSSTINNIPTVEIQTTNHESCLNPQYSIMNTMDEVETKTSAQISLSLNKTSDQINSKGPSQDDGEDDDDDEIPIGDQLKKMFSTLDDKINPSDFNSSFCSKSTNSIAFSTYYHSGRSNSQPNLLENNLANITNHNPRNLPLYSRYTNQPTISYPNQNQLRNSFDSILNLANGSKGESHHIIE